MRHMEKELFIANKTCQSFSQSAGPTEDSGFRTRGAFDGEPDSIGSGETVGLTATGNLTSPGTAIGTIAYMSPEQARGDDIDAGSAFFSAGSALYELVSRQLPFPGKTSAVIRRDSQSRAAAAGRA